MDSEGNEITTSTFDEGNHIVTICNEDGNKVHAIIILR